MTALDIYYCRRIGVPICYFSKELRETHGYKVAEAYYNLDKAMNELKLSLIGTFKLDKIVQWLARKV